jgi:uncharacterized protein with NRDE domain
MCLLLLAFHVVPQRPWLLLGNRDEFHARATATAQPWADDPQIIGGRDLEAGGSWLALNRNGRFAAVTNVRTGKAQRGPRSRGELVSGFVRGTDTPAHYTAEIARQRDQYGPFNLIVGDRESAYGASSLRVDAWPFASGVHVLSNGPPDAAWPKIMRLRDRFDAILHSGKMEIDAGRSGAATGDTELLDLLADTAQPADAELPDTGVGLDLERILAPIFIRGPQYGTRASTLAYLRNDGSPVLRERSFGPNGADQGLALIQAQVKAQERNQSGSASS